MSRNKLFDLKIVQISWKSFNTLMMSKQLRGTNTQVEKLMLRNKLFDLKIIHISWESFNEVYTITC